MFLFVAPSEVAAVAERFGATPFDIEGVFWSHRGELCTFDVMLEEFGAAHAGAATGWPLIVRGADTARPDLAPEAAGLLAASLGLSRMHRDDLAQLDAGMALYDAFYRWCRDATDETHNWPRRPARTSGRMTDAAPSRPSPRRCASGCASACCPSAGRPAQIALMHREVVDERHWVSDARFLHALNFCTLLPGPEAQQLATYLGWLMHGVKGGLAAGLLFILPGALVMLALSIDLRRRSARCRSSPRCSSG